MSGPDWRCGQQFRISKLPQAVSALNKRDQTAATTGVNIAGHSNPAPKLAKRPTHTGHSGPVTKRPTHSAKTGQEATTDWTQGPTPLGRRLYISSVCRLRNSP